MRTLEQRLDAIKAASVNRVPAASRAVMQQAKEELIATGQHQRSLGEGDAAPGFLLSNSAGEAVSLAGLLSQGPVVLTFFRGHW